ncbi:MAG: nucleoside monophosphate kinase [Candidatus Vogelbacteria bacterium]|nr:nucleoside monophosphate kinase [Candidatus Vogelbacteria bacterium]
MKTVIFIGRSGCGKGTQAKRLIERFGGSTLYLETGERFRHFIAAKENLSSRLAGEIMVKGGRQPDFLAVWNWSNFFISNLTGQEHLIIDGAPRSRPEAETMDSAFDFYSRRPVAVVYLNVSKDWATERLTERGRSDDKTSEEIAARFGWFDDKVMPAVEYYRGNQNYNFAEINGEQSVELVFAEILSKLKLDVHQAKN